MVSTTVVLPSMPSFWTSASIRGPLSIMTVAGPRPSSRVMVSSLG